MICYHFLWQHMSKIPNSKILIRVSYWYPVSAENYLTLGSFEMELNQISVRYLQSVSPKAFLVSILISKQVYSTKAEEDRETRRGNCCNAAFIARLRQSSCCYMCMKPSVTTMTLPVVSFLLCLCGNVPSLLLMLMWHLHRACTINMTWCWWTVAFPAGFQCL